MSVVKKLSPMSIEDYLAMERTAEVRHEYIDGYIYAMVGASNYHNLIAGNLYTLFRTHLRGSPCAAFMSDMKVKVGTRFYYPDVVVSCDKAKGEKYYETKPILIVEVLSPSTELSDAFQKRIDYQRLEGLQEYVLVQQNKPEVTVYRRNDEGWEVEIHGEGDTLSFRSLNIEVPIETLYEEVDLPQ